MEDTTESSSEGTPKDLYTDAQEVEIKGALEVTIELHLKMCMVVQLPGHRSAQNDSIKR